MGCSSSANKQAVRVYPAKKSEIRISESISRSSFLLSNRTEIEHPCEEMFPYFRNIINGIQRIPRSNELDFIACLSSNSMPLVACPTNLEDKEYSHMVLPVVAISAHGKGRVVAFGNFEILTECKQENAEYFSFLENIICYALGPRPKSSTIYFLNVGHQDCTLLSHNLTGLGYHVEIGNSAQNLSKYGAVVTYSTTRFEDEIYQYITNGGGMIVGCSFDWLPSLASLGPPDDFSPRGRKLSSSKNNTSSTSSVSSATSSTASVNITSSVFKAEKQLQQLLPECHRANHVCNCWLSRCGLGFPEVHISLPIVQKAAIKVSSKTFELEKSTFPSYINQYLKILQEEKPILSELSTITSYLRYNILCNNRCPNPNITRVLDLSVEYLQLTNYEQPEGIFYSEAHVLLAILISDIFEHIDPYDFVTRKCDDLFPGEYQPDTSSLESVKIDIQIQHISEWASTGVYLPAGQIATVNITPSRNVEDLNSFYEDLYIQVGSHSESLLSSPGPWKRWPNVVLKFPVKQGPIEIASPFGGLVYVVREPKPIINPDLQQVYSLCYGFRSPGRSKNSAMASPSKNLAQNNNTQSKVITKNTSEYKNLSLTIDNVVRSPFYIESHPGSLIMSTAPWGEIRTKNAIITLPSNVLYKIKNLDTFSQCFDKMIKQVELFVGFSTTKPFRLVFDIDQPKLGTTSSYPLMLSYDLLNSLFDIEKPSSDLFAVMMMIGIVCLPENVLGANVEAALGILAAAHVFYVVFNITTPEQFIYEHISPIFAEMWRVYSRNEIKLIPTAMAKFQIHCKTDPFTSSEEAFAFLVNELSNIAEKDFNSLLNEGLHPQQKGDQFPEYQPIDEEEPQ